MLVRDIMNSSPLTVDASRCIREAIPLMSQEVSSCLIVVDAGKPLGIITERDVTNLFARAISDSHYPEHPISEVMTQAPVCINQNSPLNEALMLSRSRKLRHLPVIDENEKLAGVVSQNNLVDAYIQLIEKHSALEVQHEQLKLLSLEDPLLGIGNRRAMEADLNHTHGLASRHNYRYCVALLDIDFFKKYNDSYGHQEGDKALRKVAQTVKHSIRSADRVFRYGGEELLILMPESTLDSASHAAERVRDAIYQQHIPHQSSSFEYLTVSIGVSQAHTDSWKTAVEAADQALYQAKSNGRNLIETAQ